MNKSTNPIDFFLPKNTTEKGGQGSGNWGHGGLAGVHGGSSPTKSAPSIYMVDGVPIATEKELAELEDSLLNSWGFSYHPIGKNSPTTGYMVSYETPTAVFPVEEYERERMKKFILENIDYFRDQPDRYFGGWVSEGKIFFDVSKNMQDLEKASMRAINQSQKAIFDVNEGDEIFAIRYLDNINKKSWSPDLIKKTFEIHKNIDNENKGDFIGKYKKQFSDMFGENFISELERMKAMTEKNIDPKDYKHEWTKKPREEWTEQDIKENMHYQETRKPIRFQFGHDATEEDVDKFLDMILGSKPKDSQENEKKG